MEFPAWLEEEMEEEEMPWLLMIRLEIIEYILRRYGGLRAKDIARILGCKVYEVNRLLRQLESSGRVKRAKLGRNYVWSPIEEMPVGAMYY
jgi:DNA-binding MarR family transcriptional regulator